MTVYLKLSVDVGCSLTDVLLDFNEYFFPVKNCCHCPAESKESKRIDE
jgi:hypothetical protein